MNQEEVVGPINCGNPGEFTMLELAEQVLAKVKSASKLTFHPLPGDDPKQRKPDITLAKKHLDGWEPKVNLDKGLDMAIAYFRSTITQ
jgi:UDP-glucuronate decarboxylase